MGALIPLDGTAKAPAYLKAIDPALMNDDLTAHASQGFPVVSIKGKVFAIVRDGERTVVPNPKDPESPATNIDVVIIKGSKATNKTWDAKGYDPDAENVKPDCFSTDGIKPDPSIATPPAKACAACPNNVWGSKVSNDGKATKGKACQDNVRIAIARMDQLNDPFLLRVPPASIRSLGEYGDLLKKRSIPYSAVLTKISFDMEEATPKLVFKPVGLLDEATFNEVQTMSQSDIVRNIIGQPGAAAPAEIPKLETPAAKAESVKTKPADEEAQAAIAKAKAEPVKPAKTKPKAEDVQVEADGLDLSALNFDD